MMKSAYAKTGAAEHTPFEEFWEKGYALQPAPKRPAPGCVTATSTQIRKEPAAHQVRQDRDVL